MTTTNSGAPHRVPLWLKLIYSAFMAVLVPYYWSQYTPVNFLWFCDVALLATLAALWLENAYLASMQAVAITLPQLLWIVDFLIALVSGESVIGMTDYMLDSSIPLFVRGLSLFHFWLPLLLLWLLYRLGYERRAWLAQIALCWLVLLLSYAATDGPTGPAGNVNKVYGPSATEAQDWMPPALWLALLMAIYPLLIYLPTHLVLGRLFRKPYE